MAVDNTFLRRRIRDIDTLYYLLSTVTKKPFVECDENTQDDQVYLFTSEEAAKAALEKVQKRQYPVSILPLPKMMTEAFLRSLYMIGVNAVILQEGGAPAAVPLETLCDRPDLEAWENEPVPKANPALQLTGIYFMQEMIKQGKRTPEEMRRFRDLEEELVHNLRRSRLIMAFDVTKAKPGWKPGQPDPGVGIALIKNKKGQVFQPVYTDLMELRNSNAGNKGQRLQAVSVPFTGLSKLITKEALGAAVNPGGFHLVITREQMEKMLQMYPEES